MTTRQLAAQYIDDQINIMRKHGDAPKLNADRRREAIDAVQRTFDAMSDQRELRHAHAESISRKAHT